MQARVGVAPPQPAATSETRTSERANPAGPFIQYSVPASRRAPLSWEGRFILTHRSRLSPAKTSSGNVGKTALATHTLFDFVAVAEFAA
jgi:hypothetical protein